MGQMPENRVLAEMLCLRTFLPSCMDGTFLAHGLQKHVQSDLDTSALGPILDKFRYKAKCEVVELRRTLAKAQAVANSDV
jgi:hypothetical protein